MTITERIALTLQAQALLEATHPGKGVMLDPALQTLRWIAKNKAELDIFLGALKHPAVAAITDAFPEARLAGYKIGPTPQSSPHVPGKGDM